MEGNSRIWRPKLNQWKPIPGIRNDKQKSQVIDTLNIFQIANSVNCVEIAVNDQHTETRTDFVSSTGYISQQEAQDISISDAVDEGEGKPRIAWLIDEGIPTRGQMKGKSKAWRPKRNQWRQIPQIRSDRQFSQYIDTQNTFQDANESLNCVQIAENCQRRETSHNLSETNITGNKCDEVTFASLSTDGTSWNRTELKTETYDGKIDSNLMLVRPSTQQNHEGGLNKEMPKSSAAEIVTSKPSPRMSTIPSNEQDLNDEKHVTNPPETTVALTNISTKEDTIVSDSNMSESITKPDMPKNKRKSRKKKKREHEDEELESAIVVMTEEQYTRRRKKKSKKRDIERMDDIG
ncbi:uncharacterized protein [Argopecten irradians]|uniref:uncharacterized protein n=1 Tax=Argopecten irradians TaxID=31199 RepID=UPI003711B7A9